MRWVTKPLYPTAPALALLVKFWNLLAQKKEKEICDVQASVLTKDCTNSKKTFTVKKEQQQKNPE